MVRFIKKYVMVILFYACRVFPIKHDKIVVSNFLGKGFGDNGKYIVLELLKRDKKYDIVWLCSDLNLPMPDGVRKVKLRSIQSVFEQATAKIWIDNRRKPGYVRKRKGQYYIQTWHGIKGLKKTEKNAESVLSPQYIANAKNDSKMADLFMANCKLDYEEYQKSWWYSGEISQYGTPRVDLLYCQDEQYKKRIKAKLGISIDQKVFLYVPTFRRKYRDPSLSIYQLDWDGVLTALHNRFEGEWVGLMRLHPNLRLEMNQSLRTNKDVINVSEYDDVQELLYIADVAVTDYSSTILDFGIKKCPGFLLAKDLEEYQKYEQGNYFKLTEFPFPLAQSDEELIACIKTFDSEVYSKKIHHFYNDVLGFYECGHASEQIVNKIL